MGPIPDSGDIQRAIDQALDIVYAKVEKLAK